MFISNKKPPILSALFWTSVLLLTACVETSNRGLISTAKLDVPQPATLVTEAQDNRARGLAATMEDESNENIMVIAHRACWRLAPENSIAAIEKCIQMGVDMVEIDVRRTVDGHLVVVHDEAVDRTTNGKGLVADLTLVEVEDLLLKENQGGVDAAVTSHRIPTLEEVLTAAKGRILVNLDAKDDIRDQAYQLAKSLGMTGQIIIKMALKSADEAQQLKQMAFFGDTYFMPIIWQRDGDLDMQVKSLAVTDPVAYEVIYESEQQLTSACELAKVQHSRCWVNTLWEELSPGHSDDVSVLDPAAHWGHLVRLGVNMVQTDRPKALIEYLSSNGLR